MPCSLENDLLVLVGLYGSERLSLKERVIVGTWTALRIRQRSGLCQMSLSIAGTVFDKNVSKDIVTYYDPDTDYLLMVDCKLKNSEKIATRIFNGSIRLFVLG